MKYSHLFYAKYLILSWIAVDGLYIVHYLGVMDVGVGDVWLGGDFMAKVYERLSNEDVHFGEYSILLFNCKLISYALTILIMLISSRVQGAGTLPETSNNKIIVGWLFMLIVLVMNLLDGVDDPYPEDYYSIIIWISSTLHGQLLQIGIGMAILSALIRIPGVLIDRKKVNNFPNS